MTSKKVKLQDKIKNLEELGKYFNNSNNELDLEEAVDKYDQASALVREIKQELNKIELKIEEINLKNSEESALVSEEDIF